VLEAAHIKAGHSISFADAFAVSLANELGATILTGDPEFKKVEGIAKIEWMET
jgi:ribonuclease VapC